MTLRRLIDGRHVEHDAEEWRHECEARMICNRPTLQDRRMYLDEVENRRGSDAAQKLRETMGQIWKARGI